MDIPSGYDIHSLPWKMMALIEIDGLPSYKMGGSFHGELLVITRHIPSHTSSIFE